MRTIVRASPLATRYTIIFDGDPCDRYQWAPKRLSKIIGIELFYYLEKGQTIESITVGNVERLAVKCPAAYFRCSTKELIGSYQVSCYMTLDLGTVGPYEPFTIVFSEPIAPLAIHYMDKP